MRDYNEAALYTFFADVMVLKSVCDADAYGCLQDVLRYHDLVGQANRERFSLLNGYKLVVATPLYSFLNLLVDYAELFGLVRDDRLCQWWAFSPSKYGLTSRLAFTDPDSDLAYVCGRILAIIDLLLKAGTWESVFTAMLQARSLGDSLWPLSRQCTLSVFDDTKGIPEFQTALRLRAAERLIDYVEDERTLSLTYNFVWHDADDLEDDRLGELIWGDPIHDIETHLDRASRLPKRHSFAWNWRLGIFSALCVSAYRLRTSRNREPVFYNQYSRDTGSAEGQLAYLQATLGEDWPSLRYGLVASGTLTLPDVLEFEEANMNSTSHTDRLRELLGNDSRLVASNLPWDSMDFKVILTGLLSEHDDGEPVEVIRIRHSTDGDHLTWFSMAVRLPRFGAISNASKWWVFYKINGVGMPEPDLVLPRKIVHDTLAEFGDRIRLIELEDVTTHDLLDLCEPPGWRYLIKEARRLVNLTKDLKGVMPELLSAALLAHDGYQNIRMRLKPAALHGKEIDVVGVKATPDGNQCLIVETKGRATTDRELQAEIDDFSAKVRILQGKSDQLAGELAYQGTLDTFRTRFISMADIEGSEHAEDAMEVWSFDHFIGELERARVPPEYRAQLKRAVIAKEMDVSEWLDDSWFEANDDESRDSNPVARTEGE